jgi:hypothetical protein
MYIFKCFSLLGNVWQHYLRIQMRCSFRESGNKNRVNLKNMVTSIDVHHVSLKTHDCAILCR